MEVMTDLQFITILEMVDMILDGCESIEEAKEKVERLIEQRREKKRKGRVTGKRGNGKGGEQKLSFPFSRSSFISFYIHRPDCLQYQSI